MEAISGECVTGGRIPIGRQPAGQGCHWSVDDDWKHKEILQTQEKLESKEIHKTKGNTEYRRNYWKHKEILETERNTENTKKY